MSAPPLARALLPAFSALALGSCFAPEPKPEDWLAYGFRGPEATFHSFLTALAGDAPELEYRCLSQAMKEREGGSLLTYLVFRDEVLGSRPWLKAAARAEIESVQYPEPGRARIEARVDWLFWDEPFTVELVSEGFYEYWSGADRLEDGYCDFALSLEGESAVARIPAPADTDLAEITEARAGVEWKIDRIELPGEEPAP